MVVQWFSLCLRERFGVLQFVLSLPLASLTPLSPAPLLPPPLAPLLDLFLFSTRESFLQTSRSHFSRCEIYTHVQRDYSRRRSSEQLGGREGALCASPPSSAARPSSHRSCALEGQTARGPVA